MAMIIRDDDKVKKIISANLSHYRRELNLTQAELAEKIHYSDKSISKWERGDGVPDIFVLVMLAQLFGVTVNDFLTEKHRKSRKTAPKLKRSLVTLLSVGLVWLLATIAFFVTKVAFPDVERAWICFVLAIPAAFTVAIVLTVLWHPVWIQFLCVSGLVWGISVALHICVKVANMHLIYTIAAVLQVLIVMWYLMRHTGLLTKIMPGFKIKLSPDDTPSSDQTTSIKK